MARLMLVVAVMACSVVAAEDGWIKPHAEAMKTKATTELKRAKEDLAMAKKARVNQAYRGPKRTDKGFVLANGNEKRAAIAYFEAEIKHWERALIGEVVPLPHGELTIGQIGVVATQENLVTQVVSPTAAIIDVNSDEARSSKRPQRRSSGPAGFEAGTQEAFSAFQSAREAANADEYFNSRLLWVEISTVGMVDGENATIDRPLAIIGTKRYETVIGGSKTLLISKALTDEDIAEYRRIMTFKPVLP